MDLAISRAVLELLEAVGYAALAVEQVAARAGVGKAAIYRRWPSKAEMVFAVVVHGDAIEPLDDTGCLADGVRALVERVVLRLSGAAARQALPGLLADLQRDPELGRRFHSVVIESQRALVADVLQQAVSRGELTAQPDVSAIHAQLLGTVFAWLHLLGQSPPDDLVDRVSAGLVAALIAPNPQ